MNLSLLAPDEPPPVSVENEHGRSKFILVCDHAGRALPRSVGDLGLSEEDRHAHIAWDIGAAGVARRLARKLDAVLFLQHYSRLVIDCNRPLEAKDSIPETTGGVNVPGNQALRAEERAARAREIFSPYHDRVRMEIEARGGKPYCFVSVHSFTPVLYGERRRFHAGVLYHDDTRLAAPLLEELRSDQDLVVGDNEPYRASPQTDYSIIEHAQKRGMPYVELEVRQDLIAEPEGQERWAERLMQAILRAAERAGI